MGWHLEWINADGEPSRHPLSSGANTIGRSEENDLCILDDALEKLHARIVYREDGEVMLIPESGATVTVDGRATRDTLPLKAGASVQIGAMTFTLVEMQDDEPEDDDSPTEATRFIAPADLPKAVAAKPKDLAGGGAGHYDLLEKISDGGQAVIYKARDRRDGSLAAIKLFKAVDNDPDAERRFQGEVDILKALDHPNVVACLGTVTLEDEWGSARRGLVMEFLDGPTLKEWVAQHPRGTSWAEAVPIMEQCLSGLEAALEHGGVVHRDIKPSNIFILPDGTVKLIDFGVAHVHTEESQTSAGLLGSFDYMAPDFARAEASFRGDVISDIFGLFVCFYELLTGRLPFPKFGERPDMEYLNRWRGDPPPVSHAHIVFRVVAHLSRYVDRGLHVDRDARFRSYQEIREALGELRNRIITHGEDEYELLDGLGAGAFGEVFKARRKSDQMLVAIKRLFPDRSGEKFVKEARILAKAHHPGIVRYLDFFQGGSDPRNSSYFLVMEYLDGIPGASLRDRIRASANGLPLAEVVPMFLAYTSALGQLHYKGIVHRDIKPANLYAPAGEPERACIMDLGVARDLAGTKTTGSVPGSWDYMAPELLSENTRGSPRSDLYALGLCLYEALTGKPAFPRLPRDDREAYPELLARANGTSKNTISFKDGQFEFYPELARLVRSVCSRQASERPRDARVLFDALLNFGMERLDLDSAAWADSAPPAMPETEEEEEESGTRMLAPEAPGKKSGKGRWVASLVILLALAGGAGWWWLQSRGWPQAPVAARTPPDEISERPAVTAPEVITAAPEPEPDVPAIPEPAIPADPVVDAAAATREPVTPPEVTELVRQIEILHRLYPVSFGYESFERDISQRVRSLNGNLLAVRDQEALGHDAVIAELRRFWTKMMEYAMSEAVDKSDPLFYAVAREGIYQVWRLLREGPPDSIRGVQQARDLFSSSQAEESSSASWPLGPLRMMTFSDVNQAFLDHFYGRPSSAAVRARVLPPQAQIDLEAVNPQGRATRTMSLSMHLVPDGDFPSGEMYAQPTAPFYMAALETTIEAMRIYRDDAGRHGEEALAFFSGQVNPVHTRGEGTLPYAAATLDEAVEFCNWLSYRAGLPFVYRKQPGGGWLSDLTRPGFRLPTESEWMYAARLGIDFEAMDGQPSWSELQSRLREENLVHYFYQPQPRSSETSPAYPLGLRDLAGNVHEICMVDPTAAQRTGEAAIEFVTKGGAANSKAASAVMPEFRPGQINDPDGMVGFRVVLPIPFADYQPVYPR